MTEKMFKLKQKYSAKLEKAAYTDVFNVLKMSLKLVSYRERILQIWWQITLLVTKTQAVTFFKETYKECYRIFKEQVAQSDLSFVKRV